MKIKLGNIIKGLLREGLQTLPVIGTIVTNIKTKTPEKPEGKVKLGSWDIYRLVIGIGVGYVLVKGMLTINQLKFILNLIGF